MQKEKSRILKAVKWPSLLILCLFLVACNQTAATMQSASMAEHGVLDLRGWDFEADGAVNLAGEWAFYWEELLEPSEITSSEQSSYVTIPDVWTNYEIEGKALPSEGFATYHLTLYFPQIDQVYGFYIEGQGSAYSLWVDGQLIAQNGEVGSTRQSMIPEKIPTSVFFQPTGETVEIVVQVSNFHHRKGGFRNNLMLDLAESIHDSQFQDWFIDALSVGILFIIGLYHLFIYAFRAKNKAALYFTIIAFLMMIRIGVTDQNTLMRLFPILSWSAALRLEYLTFFLTPIPFALFMQSLYPKDVHR